MYFARAKSKAPLLEKSPCEAPKPTATGVAAVALEETPVEVKQELLPRSKIDRSRSMNRVSILSLPGGAKQSLGDCKTRIEEEVAGRKKQARTKQIATIELEHWNDLPR